MHLSLALLLACAARPDSAPAPAPITHTHPAPAATDAVHEDATPHAEHAGHGDDATVRHGFEDAERWAQVFDDPARDAWQKPTELVAALELEAGQVVADIGAGTGYFNRHLASAVGADGTVIAVDIEPDMVKHMTDRATAESTPTVQARLGQPDDPGLAPAEVHLVLLVDTYHHIDDRIAYFSALRQAVKPGGRLVVVDFKAGDIPVGPPEGHRIPHEQVRSELLAAGWTEAESLDLLPYQFVQIMWRDAPAP